MAKPNVVIPALKPELGWPCYQQSSVERWQGNERSIHTDYIAEEVPVSLVYNGTPHIVMLMTPANLEDFALGFSLTEGIINKPDEILGTHVYNRSNGIEVRLEISENRFCNLADKGRNLTGRTGCGLCGASTLEQVVRYPEPVAAGLKLPINELVNALSAIGQQQPINKLTGAVHAAAWAIPGQGIQYVREDVGRHNALDKLIGLLIRLGKNPAQGYIVMTSRASFEIVQKAASVGISLLAAMSAPTGLAIRIAEECGLTLIGFARQNQQVVYTHPHRLTPSTQPLLQPA
ncbi:MAG: formate dehydrogenase accessory sulfurtransferase FdhD [Gammaproteobacteria bacterium]|nr:formate dehydrogenase accessory sulfurtransferase FdhD [Gammaproteobacteria bacterium]